MNANVTSTTKSAASPDDLSEQIDALRADLAKLAATIRDDISAGIGSAGREIGKTSRDAQATATNAVIGHPLTAIGIAVGVGLLLGLVARKG